MAYAKLIVVDIKDGSSMATAHNESSLPKYNIKRLIFHIILGIVVPIVMAIVMNQAIAQEAKPPETKPAIYAILINDEADKDGYVIHNKTTIPQKTTNIYVTVQITNAHPGIKVTSSITGVSNGMATETAVNVTSKSGNIMKAFTFTNNDKPWPKGDYKVTVSLSDGGSKDSTFTIN